MKSRLYCFFRWAGGLSALGSLTLAGFAGAQTANVTQSGQYAPGARSSATSNGVLDSVIGQHPSMVTRTLQASGVTYYVAPDGRVLDHQKYLVSADPAPSAEGGRHQEDVRTNVPEHTKLVPVLIGVMNTGIVTRNHLHFHGCETATQPLMHSPVDPVGVFVAPAPCQMAQGKAQTQIHQAARMLAHSNGNMYSLAGNRDQLVSATQVDRVSDHEIVLRAPPHDPSGASSH